ncbi:exosortase/archaeosortase family protein [Microbacterium sp. RURRCA19A]|uniref:exosortase/archaeosortase family protein n=1 Tax=Microbacterium sp. RURRCA19A TaxID=1907391 RepID=UPI000953C08C|nr:exosortase/archaeosortase family protein [Microbacterium sp. RURRCA19A]SIR93852.1 exosortase/archaeosortase family protein [Microbacterium sp. RURRCA19A]
MSSDQLRRRSRTHDSATRPGWGQRALALAAILAAAASLVFIEWITAAEALATAFWTNPLLPGGVLAARDNFVVQVDGTPIAFHVTPGCSAAVLLAPALVVYGVILLVRRIPLVRAVVAGVVMFVVIVVTNQLRLGMIGWASQTWGMDVGYQISHRYVGSALAIVGFCAGVVLLFLLTSRQRRTRRNVTV